MTQALRDELEAILRGWNAYEVARRATPVIDFDLRPDLTDAVPVESRLEAYHRCLDVQQRATDPAASHIHDRAEADATYLAALLGPGRQSETFMFTLMFMVHSVQGPGRPRPEVVTTDAFKLMAWGLGWE